MRHGAAAWERAEPLDIEAVRVGLDARVVGHGLGVAPGREQCLDVRPRPQAPPGRPHDARPWRVVAERLEEEAELVLLGRFIDAETARTQGLVNAVAWARLHFASTSGRVQRI